MRSWPMCLRQQCWPSHGWRGAGQRTAQWWSKRSCMTHTFRCQQQWPPNEYVRVIYTGAGAERTMQKPHVLQCDARGGRHTLQVLQYLQQQCSRQLPLLASYLQPGSRVQSAQRTSPRARLAPGASTAPACRAGSAAACSGCWPGHPAASPADLHHVIHHGRDLAPP